MGLVNRVVPQAELESYVQGYADTIAANAPLTVVSVNRIINEIMKDPEDRDLAMCEQVVRTCFESQDYIEDRQAFMEKRKPAYVGRCTLAGSQRSEERRVGTVGVSQGIS